MERIVVVGGSLAGLRAVETLRATGFGGEVVVLGAEPHRPYDRPPLSKKLLAGEWELEHIQLRRPDAFDELDVAWKLGVTAAGLNLDERRIHLVDNASVRFDGCIIATGAFCRRLPDQSRYAHVYEVRTVNDSLRLRAEIAGGKRRVVVVGAGFIGLEVAATAHQLGNDVVVLEGAIAPMIRGLGEEMGSAIGALHQAAGLDIRCGVRVQELHNDGVIIADADRSELVPADVVVVGIGVAPSTEWLNDSGIELRDGVVCDTTLRALRTDGSAVPAVYAAGDLLRWHNEIYDEEMRLEHWTNAAEQGAVAAKNLVAELADQPGEPYAPVPFFWSDQLDLRIQFVGRAGTEGDQSIDVKVAAGSTDEGKWLALYSDPATGRLWGALGVNAPRWVMPMRQLLATRASLHDGLAMAASYR